MSTIRLSSAIAGALAAASLAACGAKSGTPAPAPPPQVGVTTVHPVDVPLRVDLPGRTSAFLVAQVRARVDGVVQQRLFTEGADVRKDQALYRIDAAPYRAALASALAVQQKAAATLTAASVQAERFKTLIGGNAVSKQSYDNAVAAQAQAAADLAAAKAAVDNARINLGYTEVVAPIAGRSSVSQVTQGAYVQAGAATLLTTVQQIDPIYVDLTESSVAGLRLRNDIASGKLQPSSAQGDVSLTLEDGKPYPLAGKLQFSGVTVDANTGSVTVRAVFPNPQHVLLPGMFVHADLAAGTASGAFLVPASAVSHDPQGQATAMVVGKDGKATLRVLETQGMKDSDWIVSKGLRDGDSLIVDGLQHVQPGMLVKAAAPASPSVAVASAR